MEAPHIVCRSIDRSTGPKEDRSTALWLEEEAIAVAFRKHTLLPLDDCLYALQPARLVGAILLEQNNEWSVQRARYLTLETITGLSDDPLVNLPLAAA